MQYVVTIRGRFPEATVDANLAAFQQQISRSSGFLIGGESPVAGIAGVDDGHLWCPASWTFDAKTIVEAVDRALRAYTEGALGTLGHLNGLDLDVRPDGERAIEAHGGGGSRPPSPL
jgi:hypothetical protein